MDLPLARPGFGDTCLVSASRTRVVSAVSIQRVQGVRRGGRRNESKLRINGDFHAGVWRGVEVEPATVQREKVGAVRQHLHSCLRTLKIQPGLVLRPRDCRAVNRISE